MTDWINRLGKWRSVFTGRMVGTVPRGHSQGEGWRDLFDCVHMLRAEVNAQTQLLVNAKVFTAEQFTEQLHKECAILCSHYERLFPGFTAEDWGTNMKLPEAHETTKGWPP